MATTGYRRFGPRLTVSLSGGDYDRLQALAQKDEVSISWGRAARDRGILASTPAAFSPNAAARESA